MSAPTDGDRSDRIEAEWRRERPDLDPSSIGVVTRVWELGKIFGDRRRRLLAEQGIDPALMDLLGLLRRGGAPHAMSTRELTERAMVSAGAISQRVARAEDSGLVTRRTATDGTRAVLVTLTKSGHDLIERTVDHVLTRESELVASLTPASRELLAGQLQELLGEVEQVARKPS